MNERQRLTIRNLGPIKNCEIDLVGMIVLDGPQASGKSTVAKAIFFFRMIKDFLAKFFFSSWSDPVVILSAQYSIRQKFYRFFDMDNFGDDSLLYFEYSPNVKIEISKQKTLLENKSDTWDGGLVKFSDVVIDWLFKKAENLPNLNKSELEIELQNLFNDDKEVVYIPAGRSMPAILSDTLSHILFNFDDEQKKLLGYCTTDYINRVTKIRPLFNVSKNYFDSAAFEHNPEFTTAINEKIEHILKGKYEYSNGKEFLQISPGNGHQKIGIEFASSGQQEVLWILNLIYYHLITKKRACFIIEEPEAHLYPNSQKDIAEFIALALSKENECIITTHSPYILGTLSNLLDAKRLADKGYDISKLLEKENLTSAQLLDNKNFAAYFVADGELQNAVDPETGLIKNELIDGASDEINGFADDLMYIEREGKN